MEFLLAGVFLCLGLSKVFGYRRKAKESESGQASGFLGLPYGLAASIGLFEVVAAMALIAPAAILPSSTLVLPAAVGLAILTVAASIYRARRQESAVPTIVLFLMAIFVVTAHWL